MRLKEAYKLNREHTISKNISEFGATPSNPDNTAAFAKAVVWLNEQTNPPCLIFEPGIYVYETSPNWAVNDAVITSCGIVRLRCTGSGDSFILDGGVSVLNMRVGRLFIEGHDGSGDGIYMQGVHHSYLDFNVRGCGTTQAGLRTEWCVVNKYHYICSGNEGGGFYNDGSGVAKPKYGAYLDDNASAQQTSYCLWIDPIIEGTEIGVHIVEGSGNQFNGGTIEGNTDWGVKIDSGCTSNKFIGGDFEANTNGDILVAGAETDIIGSDSDSLIQFSTGGRDSKIIGGANDSLTVDSGVTGIKLIGTSYNRTGSGVLTGIVGSNTYIEGLTNIGTAVIIPGFVVPTSLNVVAGGTPVGNILTLTIALDGNEYNLPETTGVPGIDLEVNFTNVVQIRGIVVNGRYTGGGAHYVDIQIRNYTTAADVTVIRMNTSTTNNYRTILIPDDSDFIDGSGNAQITFYHPTTGNSTHDLYIDYVALIS